MSLSFLPARAGAGSSFAQAGIPPPPSQRWVMDAFIGSLTVSLRSGLIHSHASSPSPHALSFKWKTLHHQNSPGFLSLLSRSGWMSFQKQTNKLSWALLKGLNEWVLIHTCFYRANHPSRQRWVRIDPGVGGDGRGVLMQTGGSQVPGGKFS